MSLNFPVPRTCILCVEMRSAKFLRLLSPIHTDKNKNFFPQSLSASDPRFLTREVRRHVVRQSYPSRQSLRYNREVIDRNLTKDAASVLSSKTKLQRDPIEQNSKTTHLNEASSRPWNSYILTPINRRREQDNEIHWSLFCFRSKLSEPNHWGNHDFVREETVVDFSFC